MYGPSSQAKPDIVLLRGSTLMTYEHALCVYVTPVRALQEL